jgi:DNA-binding response OmpR family regulator
MTEILIVDDEPTVRALLRDLLELEGHEVREAADGIAALDAMRSEPPDLVVLDIMMPGMSGIEVLHHVRADPNLFGVPVLVLTAKGDDETTWAGWTAGATSYLCKPFAPDNLLAWIDRLLSPVPS